MKLWYVYKNTMQKQKSTIHVCTTLMNLKKKKKILIERSQPVELHSCETQEQTTPTYGNRNQQWLLWGGWWQGGHFWGRGMREFCGVIEMFHILI